MILEIQTGRKEGKKGITTGKKVSPRIPKREKSPGEARSPAPKKKKNLTIPGVPHCKLAYPGGEKKSSS